MSSKYKLSAIIEFSNSYCSKWIRTWQLIHLNKRNTFIKSSKKRAQANDFN